MLQKWYLLLMGQRSGVARYFNREEGDKTMVEGVLRVCIYQQHDEQKLSTVEFRKLH